MLPNAEVYIQGGSGGWDYPEVRQSDGSFRLLDGAYTGGLSSGYPRNFVGPDGLVFGIADWAMYRVDPAGDGSMTDLGTLHGDNAGATSTAVMFAPGRILQAGGGSGFASRNASIIDINGSSPVVTQLPETEYRRHWGTATVMADGRVMLSGGSALNNEANEVAYAAEIFDPVTNTWTTGDSAARMRLYHSTSLLLPDATVITMGGGAPGPETNLNAEIYYPPYLFEADGDRAPRPTITSTTPVANPGTDLTIESPDAADVVAGVARQARVRHPLLRHGPAVPGAAVHADGDLVGGHVAGQRQQHTAGLLHGVRDRRRRRALGGQDRADQRGGDKPEPPPTTTTTTTTTPETTTTTTTPETTTTTTTPGATTTTTARPRPRPPPRFRPRRPPAAATPAAATPPPPPRAARVVNGSFERNPVARGRVSNVANLQGWTNPNGAIEVWRRVAGSPAGQGRSFIQLDRSGRGNRATQSIATQSGRRYTLSLRQSPEPGVSARSNRFTIYWNGTRLGVIGRSGRGLTRPSWQTSAFTVTGTGRDVISFRERDANGTGAFIDDVRLVAN